MTRTLTVLISCAIVVGACSDSSPSPGEGIDVDAIVDDLNDYWDAGASDLGFDYTPIDPGQVGPADDLTCDRSPIDPGDVDGNAFVDAECVEGLIVAYDPAYLAVDLSRARGVLAHEWGHVIQAQADHLDLSLDDDGLAIDAELQADCFAGAWAADRHPDSVDELRADTTAEGDDLAIDDPDAHGNASERTTAFDVGAHHGPTGCVDELIDALP